MRLYGVVPGGDKFEKGERGIGVGLGNFDGVHKGHAALIDTLIKQCGEMNLDSMIYTFENHPVNVLFPDRPTKLIITNTKKATIIKSKGVSAIYFEHFDKKFAAMTAEEFVKNVIVDTLGASLVVVGHNHTFGKDGEGNPALLKTLGEKYGFKVTVIPPITAEGDVISSTSLRELVGNGNIDRYESFTGRVYSIPGLVEHGRSVGRLLGFPTANIVPRDGFAVPRSGVYATKTIIGWEKYYGITNIGDNPTFNVGRMSIETHLFDFDDNLYGQTIEVEFYKRIRDEKTFSSVEELRKQMVIDIDNVKKYFGIN